MSVSLQRGREGGKKASRNTGGGDFSWTFKKKKPFINNSFSLLINPMTFILLF